MYTEEIDKNDILLKLLIATTVGGIVIGVGCIANLLLSYDAGNDVKNDNYEISLHDFASFKSLAFSAVAGGLFYARHKFNSGGLNKLTAENSSSDEKDLELGLPIKLHAS